MTRSTDPANYRFSFGPWNISEGGDPFGPETRASFPHEEKFALYRPLGFEGVQLHDDDVVPGLDDLTAAQIAQQAAHLKTSSSLRVCGFPDRRSMVPIRQTARLIVLMHGIGRKSALTSREPSTARQSCCG